ncbi:periplasmic heavy metal sensor [Spirosoma endbachense]|uniref:Periplasmic heavy metal sensor n=1 Tax=Spirosoma endbachense TaxID=2666025 RepID=A0A6P1VVI5_9BACT|nr:periplasmic heavy metal sensor [Spirosoma endbachense]QHV97093.1 periplasmic heavy metal sensor [Spirosoma endbachense]
MERTKLLTFAVIGLLLLNLLTIGFVWLKPDQSSSLSQGPPPEGDGPARLIIERLHFDTQQQQQYRQLVQEHQRQTRVLNQESVQLFRAYYGLLASTQPDSARANTLSHQIADNQRSIAELNFAHFQQIKALCQPDQQPYFTKLVDDLAHLFGRRQRPPRPNGEGPPEGRPEGPPENFPSRP